MRKFFTIAAAILFAGSMMAETPSLESFEWGADDFATVIANHDGITLSSDASAWKGNFSGVQYLALGGGTDMSATAPTPYFGITATNIIDSIEVYWAPNGTNQTNIAWAAWTDAANLLAQDVDFLGTTASHTGSKSLESAIWQKIDLTGKDVKAIMLARQIKKAKLDGAQQANLGDNQTVNILGIRVWVNGVAPIVNTDPVAQITISGPTEAWVGQKVTLKATTDVKADTIWWTDQYGTVQTSKKGVFEFTPDAEGTYTYTAWAENQYNTQPVSLEHSVVATVKPVLEQVVVTDHTTWDFTKAGTGSIEWKDNTTPAKDVDTVLMANIDGINNDANFNAQALMFAGQYPIRESKYCQGPYLEFVVNAPGLVTVDFSNTGSKDVARYVMINGVVNTTVGSLNTTKVTSEAIHVEPGTVTIQGAFEDGTVQYLRIYKVVYQRTGWPTAVEDNEVEVKAIKRIVNGQLVIEKNGVLYNAQGAIVK